MSSSATASSLVTSGAVGLLALLFGVVVLTAVERLFGTSRR